MRAIKAAPDRHRAALTKQVVSESRKGKVSGGAVARISQKLNAGAVKNDDDDDARLIGAIEAGTGERGTVAEAGKAVPALSEDPADDALNAGLELVGSLRKVRAALRGAKSAGTLPPVLRPPVLDEADKTRRAIDRFLRASETIDTGFAPLAREAPALVARIAPAPRTRYGETVEPSPSYGSGYF